MHRRGGELRLSDEEIEANWIQFLEGKELEIMDAVGSYPGKRNFTIDFNELDLFSPDFAKLLLEEGERALRIGQKRLRALASCDLDIWTVNLPEDSLVEVSKVGKEHIGKLVSIAGIVKRISPVMPRLVTGAFKCSKCPHITIVPQEDLFIREPSQCDGCHRTDSKYSLVEEQCDFTDLQRLEIQESPEGLKMGRQPSSLVCHVENSMVNVLIPGRRAIFNGVIQLDRKKDKQPSALFSFRFHINSVNSTIKDYEDLVITEEDEIRIKEIASKPDMFDKLASSVAPAIFGHADVKESLALQLFGGCQGTTTDGMVLRGDIHILLCGDPGLAKSKMLEYMSELAPRGIFASGKSASAAGLTAAAVKDPLDKDKWSLEAGAMVMADGGFVAIDEMDKMSEEDRSAMHEGMEGQKIHFAKAGIVATLSTRCSVLGACNPKYGRFDNDTPYFEQINLMPTLLSRFDLVHILLDKGDPKTDLEIAERMLRNRAVSEEPAGVIDRDTIRKWVAIGKRLNPAFSPEAEDLLKKNYVEVKKHGRSKRQISITPRQMEAYIRLSQASARARLSEEISIEDARRAVRLVSNALNTLCPDGDIDPILTGTSHSEHDRIKIIKEIIIRCDNNIRVDALEKLCKDKGIDKFDMEKAITKMRQAGELIMPRYGTVALVSP